MEGPRDILPIIQISISLSQLRTFVDEMTAEEKIIPRLNGQSVTHERGRIDDQSRRHFSRDTILPSPNDNLLAL